MNRTCAGAGTGGRNAGTRNTKAEKGIRQDFCPACGHEIIWDDEEYCPFCGEKLDSVQQEKKSTGSGSGGGIIFLICIIAAVILFLARK